MHNYIKVIILKNIFIIYNIVKFIKVNLLFASNFKDLKGKKMW